MDVYALKNSNGDIKYNSEGKVEYDEKLIEKHFLEAIEQAGQENWKSRYFVGNDFLTTVYSEYVEHVLESHNKSRDQSYLQGLVYPAGLFCDALKG